MEAQTYVVTGTITDHKTVRLDEALPITAAKVRVTIEIINDEIINDEIINEKHPRPLAEVLAEIHEGQRARGHQPPTPQEVDEYLRQERDSWE
jgi:hypothetical protein